MANPKVYKYIRHFYIGMEMFCSRCRKKIEEGEERIKEVDTRSGKYVVILCKDCFERWGNIPF